MMNLLVAAITSTFAQPDVQQLYQSSVNPYPSCVGNLGAKSDLVIPASFGIYDNTLHLSTIIISRS